MDFILHHFQHSAIYVHHWKSGTHGVGIARSITNPVSISHGYGGETDIAIVLETQNHHFNRRYGEYVGRDETNNGCCSSTIEVFKVQINQPACSQDR